MRNRNHVPLTAQAHTQCAEMEVVSDKESGNGQSGSLQYNGDNIIFSTQSILTAYRHEAKVMLGE